MAKPKTAASSEHMAELGRKGGLKTKRRRGKEYYSRIAKMSHRKNNPNAKRKTYKNGGRKPKDAVEE